jgi:hypothetical protein
MKIDFLNPGKTNESDISQLLILLRAIPVKNNYPNEN